MKALKVQPFCTAGRAVIHRASCIGEPHSTARLSIDTKVQQYTIHMLLRGNLDRLRTTYTSEPALPPADIINLLVFGRTTEAAEANPTPGNLGAESLIASSVSSQVSTAGHRQLVW